MSAPRSSLVRILAQTYSPMRTRVLGRQELVFGVVEMYNRAQSIDEFYPCWDRKNLPFALLPGSTFPTEPAEH